MADDKRYSRSDLNKLQTQTKFIRNMSNHSKSTEPLPDPVNGVTAGTDGDVLNGHRLEGTDFRIGVRIGAGNFGQLRIARNMKTDEQVAVKLEPGRVANLNKEWQMYTILNKNPTVGIPKVFHYGPCRSYNALVLELLGPSLEKIFRMCERQFSLQTVLMIGIQLIDRIRYVHSQDIIHRDIKPDNLTVEKAPNSDKTLFLIDFGLAKFYSRNGKHIEYKENGNMVGTLRYMSVNAHRGIMLSRRDDMESIGYTLIYFLCGELPWQGIQAPQRVKERRVMEMKTALNMESICEELPPEIVQYMQHVRKLEFDQAPQYTYLRELFTKRLKAGGYDPSGKMNLSTKIRDKKRQHMLFPPQMDASKKSRPTQLESRTR